MSKSIETTVVGVNKMTNILSIIPERERTFVLDAAQKILNESNGEASDIVFRILEFQKGTEYGWDEAIRSGLWCRYPSEIENMMFCSEWALKNYLLCQALNIQSYYYVVEDYFDQGMSHEAVVAEIEGKVFLLDWRLHEVERIENNRFVASNEDVTFSALVKLEDEEIAERIVNLRNSESFIDALKCGQFLYKKHKPEGIIEAYVKYYPDEIVSFYFVFSPYIIGLPFYYIASFSSDTDEIREETGIAWDKNGFNFEKIPIFFNDGKLDVGSLEIASTKLDEDDLRYIYSALLYNNISENGDAKGFYRTEEERKDFFNGMQRINSGEDTPSEAFKMMAEMVLNIYNDLPKDKDVRERFIDYFIFRIDINREFPEKEDLLNFIYKYLNVKNPNEEILLFLYLAYFAEMMSAFTSFDETVLSQQMICKSLETKLNVDINLKFGCFLKGVYTVFKSTP